MNQNIWGPKLWEFLHCTSMNYPIYPTIKDKKNMYNFLMSLKPILPCRYCRDNYDKNLKEFPIRLDNRKELVCWMIDIHNEVNTRCGKRHYTYEEVLKTCENKYNKKISLINDNNKLDLTCDTHCWKSINIVIFIFIILLLLYLGRKYLNKIYIKQTKYIRKII